MRILAIVSQKGGSGKSMLARAFAVAALRDGMRSAVVDMDPQGTVRAWAARRPYDAPAVETSDAEQLPHTLAKLEQDGADIVIIDTPPHTRAAFAIAARHAHGVVIPVRPLPDDLVAVSATIDAVRGMGKPAVIVINQAPSQGDARERAREVLSQISNGLHLSPVDITDRIAHSKAAGLGLTAQEYGHRGKDAAKDIADTWIAINEFLSA